MHYFICQPIDASAKPFLVMCDEVNHSRLAIAAKRGEKAMADAMRRVFGEECSQFARLTAAEYFGALRVASDGPSDGGTKVETPDSPPQLPPSRGKAKPLSKMQQRMAAAGIAS